MTIFVNLPVKLFFIFVIDSDPDEDPDPNLHQNETEEFASATKLDEIENILSCTLGTYGRVGRVPVPVPTI